MSQVRLVKLKFKAGGKQIWLDWCEQLKNRSDEVMETLRSERTLSESCFVSQDGGSLYYFLEAEDLEHAKKAFHGSTFNIDREHREARLASLEFVEELTPVFHFRNS
ncbi:MAG: hypothetical protein HY651_04110 [Acidobacteria bacterium]|nr:hypothetical protein [Acidobacteriota bacterium]